MSQQNDTGWKDSVTLEDWVIKMIEEKRTKEPEFQIALKFWGREKFEAIWKKHREKHGISKDSRP